MRAVEHRVILVDRRVRLLAAEHQAGHLGRAAVGRGEALVDARPRADLAAGGQRRAGEEVAGLRAVDVPLQRLLVVEAADEEHLLAEVAAAARAPGPAPSPCPRPWPTTPCRGTRCPRRGRRAGPGPRSTPPLPVGSSPQTGRDSSQGRAIETPSPRSMVRRLNRWVVIRV